MLAGSAKISPIFPNLSRSATTTSAAFAATSAMMKEFLGGTVDEFDIYAALNWNTSEGFIEEVVEA